MICRFGRPVVWFTICPSQQYNPLVVQLGGDIVPKETIETLKDRMEFCMNDPVACTEFFHLTIRGVLKVLQVEIGMNQYYGVIEAQMRGTLHLHLLAWNTSHKLSSESDWIEFADKVCSATVTETPVTEEAIAKMLQQYPDEVKCEYDFIKNALILCKSTATNLHDYRHRKSCFKISGGKRTCKCRYKFPRDLVKLTSLKSDGLEMSRNHAYINCYNYLLMNLFRCNHDIRVLPNIMNDDLLALLFYLTNYTTKMENSNYSVCDVAATARRELFNELENPTARKYADRLFIRILNKITGKNEVSSNLVVNELLTYQEEYCSQKFKTLHYGILLRALSGEEFDVQLSIPKKSNASFPEEDVDDEHIVDTIVVSNLYDDYANRGDSLKFLSIYEYVSRVYKKKTDPETSISGHKFNIGHAQHGTHVQMLLAADSPYVKVPKLVGPSTMKFSDEEYVKLLILIFKPWTDINYVRSCMYENIADYMTTAAMDSDINVQLMENFMLLQKSRLAAEKKRLAKQNEQTVSAQSEDGELLRTGLNSEVDNEEEENDLENVDLENVELFEILDISRKQLSEAVTTNMTHTLSKTNITMLKVLTL